MQSPIASQKKKNLNLQRPQQNKKRDKHQPPRRQTVLPKKKRAKKSTTIKTTVAVGAMSPDSNKKKAHRNEMTATVPKSLMKQLSRNSSEEDGVDAQVAAGQSL